MWNITKKFANLSDTFYQLVKPTPLVKNIHLIHVNKGLINKLGLSDIDHDSLLQIISGNHSIENYTSLASVYMGHQFGIPVAKLGDGRALLIAEQIALDKSIWELQLKGAGPTPYSRGGDGRAVLRSSIREYLVSTAMANLGIATTQAVAIVGSGDKVIREEYETAAIVLRAAKSFIRFGHFEYYAQHGKLFELEELVRFVVANYYPTNKVNLNEITQHLLKQVVINTAKIIAQWQAIGFVHGVMNTDNMSILGLTLDYGPFAFVDEFAPYQIYNHSDSDGRYVYANQPQIAWWNLYRFAEALCCLKDVGIDALQPILDSYATYYNDAYQNLMWAKLGIVNLSLVQDHNLVEDILSFLAKYQIDYSFFWRKLSFGELGFVELQKFYVTVNFTDILTRITNEQSKHYASLTDTYTLMQETNPAFILRNHLLSEAIMKAQNGDFSEITKLFELSLMPYNEISSESYYYNAAPEWSSNINLSCSS